MAENLARVKAEQTVTSATVEFTVTLSMDLCHNSLRHSSVRIVCPFLTELFGVRRLQQN